MAETEYDDDYWYTYAEGNEIEYYHQEYGWVAATITGVDTGSFSDRYFAICSVISSSIFGSYRHFFVVVAQFAVILAKYGIITYKLPTVEPPSKMVNSNSI